MLAAGFRLLAHPAIAAVNLLNHFGALVLASGGAYLSAFDPAQLDALKAERDQKAKQAEKTITRIEGFLRKR